MTDVLASAHLKLNGTRVEFDKKPEKLLLELRPNLQPPLVLHVSPPVKGPARCVIALLFGPPTVCSTFILVVQGRRVFTHEHRSIHANTADVIRLPGGNISCTSQQMLSYLQQPSSVFDKRISTSRTLSIASAQPLVCW